VSAVRLSDAERSRLQALDGTALARALVVHTRGGTPAPGTPAVAGSHTLDADGLHFRPLFPFVPGLRYSARLELGQGPPLRLEFESPPAEGEPPRVVASFPSNEMLPENTLRFYVHFSRSMEIRDAHSQVRLEDARGRVVPLAFVEVPHGLWDPQRTRLTLLLHPGRIKRGVAPGEVLGPPLRQGESYRLVVDAGMRDGSGLALGQPFERRIRVTVPDREPPRFEAIRVMAPGAASAPLVVELPEPLDEALLHRLMWVEGAAGQVVAGASIVTQGETRWSFRPERPWSPGRYALRVHPALEDRAGNRFDRAFDRDRGQGAPDPGQETPLRLEFEMAEAPP
jgi:hypothetical protein